MGKRYLIDTSAIIKYLNGTLPQKSLDILDSIIDNESLISFITEIELKVWNPQNDFDKIVYEVFVAKADIYWIDQSIINEATYLRRTYRLKVPDTIIAATAIVIDLILIADNDKDFGKITGLTCLNPSQPNFEVR
jgi:tRNA(fMet)-specific endonuclease VapC